MVLWETEQLPPRCALEREYGAALVLDSGRVAVNCVSTLDGIVSFGMGAADSRAVSGGLLADRMVMAMLRAVAGVVMIGAGTLRATPRHQWTPQAMLPEREADLGELRAAAGMPRALASLLVVSGSGHLPAADAVARPAVPVEVLTGSGLQSRAPAGAPGPGLREATAPSTTRTARGGASASDHPPDAPLLGGAGIVAEARQRAAEGAVLCEGGPTLLGSLLDAAVPLDLFLTLAPQLAGRSAAAPQRRGLVETVALPPFARAGALCSVRAAGNHLLLRYRIDGAPR